MVKLTQRCSLDQDFCSGDPETLSWSIFFAGDSDALMVTIHCPRRLTKQRAKQKNIKVVIVIVISIKISIIRIAIINILINNKKLAGKEGKNCPRLGSHCVFSAISTTPLAFLPKKKNHTTKTLKWSTKCVDHWAFSRVGVPLSKTNLQMVSYGAIKHARYTLECA